MDGGNTSLGVSKNDIQGNQSIEHPETQGLSRLEEKQHTLIRRHRRPFHEATCAACGGRRQLAIDAQQHLLCGGPHDLYTRASQVRGVQRRQTDIDQERQDVCEPPPLLSHRLAHVSHGKPACCRSLARHLVPPIHKALTACVLHLMHRLRVSSAQRATPARCVQTLQALPSSARCRFAPPWLHAPRPVAHPSRSTRLPRR